MLVKKFEQQSRIESLPQPLRFAGDDLDMTQKGVVGTGDEIPQLPERTERSSELVANDHASCIRNAALSNRKVRATQHHNGSKPTVRMTKRAGKCQAASKTCFNISNSRLAAELPRVALPFQQEIG